jgi:hypothetical protein
MHQGTLTHDELNQLSVMYDVRLDKIYMLKEFFDKKPVGNFIINLDIDNRGGTHFVSVVSLNDKIFWFDPFGTINKELKDLIEKYHKKKIIYSNVKLQNINESNCGFWCLIFLKEAQNVKDLKSFNDAIEEMKFYKITFKNNKDVKSINAKH